MSLFPIRLQPGGTITVHLRVSPRFPMWIDRKDFLVYPTGKRVLCYHRLVPCLPQSFISPKEEKTIRQSGQIYQGAPILMAARYLQNEFNRTDYFFDMLRGLRDDTHHYYTLTLPKDAPLGRYHFDLEDRANGNIWKSHTSDTDYFYVEKLELLKVQKTLDGTIAYIENPSPEPVLAQFYQFEDERVDKPNCVVMKFEPKSLVEVPFKRAAFLLYRDGDELLRFTQEKAPLSNPLFKTLRSQNGTTIFSNDPAFKQAYDFDNKAEEIWQKSNGFLPRSFVRRQDNASIYDEMLQMGLLVEID